VIKNDVEFILMLRKHGGYRSPSVATRVLGGSMMMRSCVCSR
jgi:hypothetical protein